MEQVPSENAVSSLEGILIGVKDKFLAKADDVIVGIIVMVIFWLIAKLVRYLISDVAPRVKADTAGVLLVARLVYAAIFFLGAVIALGSAGVNWTALATSIGLTGFALGFALKDAIGNFIAGVLILFYRPFRIGDMVKVNNISGRVRDVRVRDTVIIDEHGLKTIIPNSNVFGNIIINYTESERCDDTSSPGPQ